MSGVALNAECDLSVNLLLAESTTSASAAGTSMQEITAPIDFIFLNRSSTDPLIAEAAS